MQGKGDIKCLGCGKDRFIVNQKYRLCDDCNYKRLHNGKSRFEVEFEKSKTRKPKIYKQKSKPIKATGEAEVFKEIWLEREHICTHCKGFLGNEPKVWMFSHKYAKSIRPDLRLDKENIELHCYECHFAKEFQGIIAYELRKDLYL